jgi:hypothetical protein
MGLGFTRNETHILEMKVGKKTESFYILGNRRVLARVPWIPTRYHREFLKTYIYLRASPPVLSMSLWIIKLNV